MQDARVDVHYDIASTLHRLTEHLMAHREDDTKLLRLLCKTYSVVLCSAWKDANGLYGKKVLFSATQLSLHHSEFNPLPCTFSACTRRPSRC
jgi:hypothetical protein